MLSWLPQPVDAFIIGALIIGAVQLSRYNLVLVKKDGIEDWISVLGTLRTKDFSGPRSYAAGASIYLAISLLAYFLICKVSPDTISGALKLYGAPGATVSEISKYNMPLYVAAIFLGASTVLGDRTASLIDGVTAFFQDRIDVPNRVILSARSVFTHLKRKNDVPPDDVMSWLEKIRLDGWLDDLDSTIDKDFAESRINKIRVESLNSVQELSKKEMLNVLDRVVKIMIVAGARKSGPIGISRATDFLLVNLTGKNEIEPIVSRNWAAKLLASLLAFLVSAFAIYLALTHLDQIVAGIVGSQYQSDGWPTDPGRLGYEMVLAAAPIVATIIICLSRWKKLPLVTPPTGRSSVWDVRENLPRYSTPLIWSLMINFAILWIARLTTIGQFGTESTLSSDYLVTFSALFLVQSLIPLVVGYMVLGCLDAQADLMHRPRVDLTALAGGLFTAAFAAVAFSVYNIVVPQTGVGIEFVLFGATINLLLSATLLFLMNIFVFR